MKCVNCLQVSPKTVSLQRGKWYYGISVQVFPSDADCRCATWHSENPQIASVNASSGYIYAKSAGTVRIYATATDGSGCRDFVTVTVKDSIPVESVTLNRTSLTLEKGKTAALGVTVCPTNATNRSVCWSSTNTSIATVQNGTVTGVSKGSACIVANATDGSGKSASCMVTVTGDTLVTSISVSPNCSTMTAGSTRVFHATVYPSGATNKGVTWSSSNETIATVNPNSGMVTAKRAGNVQIRATACDRGGVYGVACLQVSAPVAVEAVNISLRRKIMSLGETTKLLATVSPSNATNRTIIWSSSNSKVATVGKYDGQVETVGYGSAVITATAGGKTGYCEIVVDPREKVTISKNVVNRKTYFTVIFESGLSWESVGCDLNDQSNRSNVPLDQIEYIDSMNIPEQHFVRNAAKEYTDKQLAFLYLLDPYGVSYYLETYSTTKHGISVGALLFKRDRVYKEIFGVWPRLFTIHSNGAIDYFLYDPSCSGKTREDFYSDAETIFGSHFVMNKASLFSFGLEVVYTIVSSLLSAASPGLSAAFVAVDLTKALLFNGAIEDTLLSGSSVGINEYVNKLIKISGSSAELKTKLIYRAGWVVNVIKIIPQIINSVEVTTPDMDDLRLYRKINAESFRASFLVNGTEIDMQEFLDHCNND